MTCPDCGGPMRVYAVDPIANTNEKYRRRRCQSCGRKVRERVPLDHKVVSYPTRPGMLTDAQVMWVMTTRHSGEHCRHVLGCSANLVHKIRRRVIYKHVLPELGRWFPHHPWLTDAPAPPGMTVAAQLRLHQNRNRSCLDCEHYGGLSRPCLLDHAAISDAGMKAAVLCDDYQEEAEDEPELEAAG